MSFIKKAAAIDIPSRTRATPGPAIIVTEASAASIPREGVLYPIAIHANGYMSPPSPGDMDATAFERLAQGFEHLAVEFG